MAPPRVGVGDVAPDFTLEGTGDRDYTLSDFRGQPVVLVFYPGDNTPVCTMQLNTYSSDISEFVALNAQVLAISPQSIESHEQFTNVHEFGFPLLADTDRAVGRAFGVVGLVGFYRRSIFVLDRAGVIRFVHRAGAGLTFRRTDELVAEVRAASDAAV